MRTHRLGLPLLALLPLFTACDPGGGGDTLATARPLAPGVAETGTVGRFVDAWYRFEGDEGDWVRIQASGPTPDTTPGPAAGGPDVALSLFGPAPDHALLARSVDPVGARLDPHLVARLPQAGTYYVQVDEVDRGDDAEFPVRVELAVPASTAPETAIAAGESPTLTLVDGFGTLAGAFDGPAAEASFRWIAGAGERLELVREWSVATDFAMEIVDLDGALVARVPPAQGTLMPPLAPAEYRIVVRSAGVVGPFVVRAYAAPEDAAEIEPNDTPAEADAGGVELVASPGADQGIILDLGTPGDVDVVVLRVPVETSKFSFGCGGASFGSGVSTVFRAVPEGEVVVPFNDGWHSFTDFLPGTYHFAVERAAQSDTLPTTWARCRVLVADDAP